MIPILTLVILLFIPSAAHIKISSCVLVPESASVSRGGPCVLRACQLFEDTDSQVNKFPSAPIDDREASVEKKGHRPPPKSYRPGFEFHINNSTGKTFHCL